MYNDLKYGWLVQLLITLLVVGLGLFLVRIGAVRLYTYYKEWETPGATPLTRNLVLGLALAAGGCLLIVSFLMSSPLALIIFN